MEEQDERKEEVLVVADSVLEVVLPWLGQVEFCTRQGKPELNQVACDLVEPITRPLMNPGQVRLWVWFGFEPGSNPNLSEPALNLPEPELGVQAGSGSSSGKLQKTRTRFGSVRPKKGSEPNRTEPLNTSLNELGFVDGNSRAAKKNSGSSSKTSSS